MKLLLALLLIFSNSAFSEELIEGDDEVIEIYEEECFDDECNTEKSKYKAAALGFFGFGIGHKYASDAESFTDDRWAITYFSIDGAMLLAYCLLGMFHGKDENGKFISGTDIIHDNLKIFLTLLLAERSIQSYHAYMVAGAHNEGLIKKKSGIFIPLMSFNF